VLRLKNRLSCDYNGDNKYGETAAQKWSNDQGELQGILTESYWHGSGGAN